jgi:LPXTG-motif cell wall-anchored protein
MRRTIVASVAMLALVTGTALATTIPGTTADYLSSRPMISGTVVSVNDHQMVVDTDQGEQVTLEVDWRTMAPRDLAPDMIVRTEFLALEDCHFYAQRITAIRDGMPTDRLQAYANTRDSDAAIARNASASGNSARNYGRPYGWSYNAYNSQYPASPAGPSPSPPQNESYPGEIMSATPASGAYHFSTHPMISGQVVSVNDHQLVVNTYQGQQVGLVMDSRTVVPGKVAPGTLVRTEFAGMKDGRYYAKRVSVIRGNVAGREQAFAQTRDSDAVIAQNTTDCGCCSNMASAASAYQEPPPYREIAKSEPVVAVNEPAPVYEEATLPQTASSQPLIALFGMLAFGAAGTLMLKRHLPRA